MEQYVEEWKSIPSKPEYEVSSDGCVRHVTVGMLNSYPLKSGRLRVKLNGRWHQVDHLVLTTFVGPAPRGTSANHLDNNNANNKLNNLQWVDAKPERSCKYELCDRLVRSVKPAYCSAHYGQLYRGKELHPIRPMRARGAGTIKGKYKVVSITNHPFLPNGRLTEHRLVMSNYLGRALLSSENIHHINGNGLDNRLENLELWVVSQPSGQRVIDHVAWARKIIEQYGDTF